MKKAASIFLRADIQQVAILTHRHSFINKYGKNCAEVACFALFNISFMLKYTRN